MRIALNKPSALERLLSAPDAMLPRLAEADAANHTLQTVVAQIGVERGERVPTLRKRYVITEAEYRQIADLREKKEE